MNYLGDFNVGATVRFHFTTHAVSNGALVAPSSAFAAADFRIYKDGSATEKTTTNGITVTSPFDSITGRHLIAIDTSNNTGDTGFFAAGSDYRVEISSAKTVDGVTQSGVVIGTFSILNRSINLGTNPPANWINAAAIASDAITAAKIAAGAITAAKFAASAIDATAIANGAITDTKIGTGAITNAKIAGGAIGSGAFATGAITSTAIAAGAITTSAFAAGAIADTVLGTGAITNTKIAANAIAAGNIAASALNGKGDWNVGKTGYSLANGAITATTFASNAITADACAADFIGAAEIAASASSEIADLIAADWVAGDASPLAIASAVWSWASGRTLTANPGLDATALRTALGLGSANLDTQLSTIDGVADAIKVVTDKLATAIEDDSASGWQFTTLALANAPSGGGGGGGDTKEDIYTYFTTGTRADAFKADVSGLSTFDHTSDQVIVVTNNDKTNYQLSAATMSTLFDDTNAATLLSDFFTGLNERFDNAADIPPTIIATAVWGHATRTLTANPGLDANGIRGAVGLSSANLNTLLTTIDSVADDIKAKTEQLTFTEAGKVDANAMTLNPDLLDDMAEEIAIAVGLNVRTAAYTLAIDRTFLTEGEIRVKQRDDYVAADGRAHEVTITKPGVDFTSATVVAGAGQQPGAPAIVPTVSLHDKTVGSCVLRIEFTSAQLNVEPGVYFWDAHILISSRRNTVVDGTITVEPKYADAPAS